MCVGSLSVRQTAMSSTSSTTRTKTANLALSSSGPDKSRTRRMESCPFGKACRLSEHVLDVPLQASKSHRHPAPLVQQEQLDPVPVDQGPAEADTELEVAIQCRQLSPGAEKAVGGTEDDPSILAVGPQPGWEVELRVVRDRRSTDPAVQADVGKPPLESSQLGDRERALVGVVAARVEERDYRGLAGEELPNVTRAPSWSSSATSASAST